MSEAAAPAGYSGTPLAKKLGIKAGHVVVWVDAPDGFDALVAPLPMPVEVRMALPEVAEVDVVVCFVRELADLQTRFSMCKQALVQNGGLWFAWPKRASGITTDVTEDLIRALALSRGLVDNKVCAIDATWSGLRCVIPIARRIRP